MPYCFAFSSYAVTSSHTLSEITNSVMCMCFCGIMKIHRTATEN